MTRKNIDWNNEVIPKAIPIINEQCEKIGGPVTVRRIFYILLSMGLIDDKKYGYLSDKLARTREKGALDWDTIHDESRGIYAIMRNPAGCVLPDPDDYMLDPTPNIDTYTEVWVEKAGNVPILWPVCAKYCIRLVNTGGRTSVTYKHDGALRIENWIREGKDCLILYVSDFDADGEHFPVETVEWMRRVHGLDVNVRKVILTKQQIREHSLPELEWKPEQHHKSKQYVKDFIRENGLMKVEIDALPVDVIRSVLEEHLAPRIDPDIVARVKQRSVALAQETLDMSIREYLEQEAEQE